MDINVSEYLDLLEEELLKEDIELYSGVFWIKDIDNPTDELIFQIPTSSDGEVNSDGLDLNAKSGNTYNHEKLWKELSSNLTDNKPFDYYPRGRVMIKNGVADIYANPYLLTDNIKNFIVNNYHLFQINGIKKTRWHADNSEHYKCYLDR